MQETKDLGLIPGLGRSPGIGNGNPLQYSGLGNPMDRGLLFFIKEKKKSLHGTCNRIVFNEVNIFKFLF